MKTKLFYGIIAAVLMGLAISITIKLNSIQTELDKLTEEQVRNEWVEAAQEAETTASENNDSTAVRYERN